MKLSDAMRLADEMGLPDLRESYVSNAPGLWGGEKPPCCAIGGANIATGRTTITVIGDEEMQWTSEEGLPIESVDGFDFPDIETYCPVCSARDRYVDVQIVHLYDDHKWSRTQIADWLDSLEVGDGA